MKIKIIKLVYKNLSFRLEPFLWQSKDKVLFKWVFDKLDLILGELLFCSNRLVTSLSVWKTIASLKERFIINQLL